MHLFPTCGTKINTFLRLKLHRRRFCCANHNRTRGTPCRLPIVSFLLYHASFHLSLLNLQTGMGNYPFSLFTLPQILRWPRVVFLPVFASDFSRSTKPAPPSFGLAGETGQHRPSPAPWCAFPHPLQNRVQRVQVLLPLPQNRRKHWVFAGFLFSCVAWLCGALGFRFWLSPPSASAAPLSSTRNAPGFSFFGPNWMRFSLFGCFEGAKFSTSFLFTLPSGS